MAAKLDVPDARIVSVEHPCLVKNVDQGIKSLGGERHIQHVGLRFCLHCLQLSRVISCYTKMRMPRSPYRCVLMILSRPKSLRQRYHKMTYSSASVSHRGPVEKESEGPMSLSCTTMAWRVLMRLFIRHHLMPPPCFKPYEITTQATK